MKREPIGLYQNTVEIISLMSEGNPGALRVLMDIVKNNANGIFTLLHLDDMNVRGTQIWVGFKDHCKEILDDFIECINNRSPEMVSTINQNSGVTEKAVTSGASFK